MTNDFNVYELNNALITSKLSYLRSVSTGTKEFRELISEIATCLCYEAFKSIELEDVVVKTPIEEIKTGRLNEDNYVFVPILRAGIGMVDGIVNVIPNAKIGHIGMYRDEETFEPVTYFCKLPDVLGKEVILLDPMLATGGSAVDAINELKSKGANSIKFLTILSAPEGVRRVNQEHPDVVIYTACVDRCLNKSKYIVPGLGDAGDRIFGTR